MRRNTRPLRQSPDYDPLWYWVREREQLRIRKESGIPPPWTKDPILREFRFCNVRREDDRVTQWIAANLRRPYADHPYLWLMLCIARQVNWPDTLQELILRGGIPHHTFSPLHFVRILNSRRDRGEKVYTGAYMIAAPPSGDKQLYMGQVVIGELWKRRSTFAPQSLQQTHAWLMGTRGWGNFMAYQAVVDMRFTRILRKAPDLGTWAAAGPGTIRGLNRLHHRWLDYRLPQEQALEEMRSIYELVESNTDVTLDFSDVPNILCETDKYLRVKNSEGRPRALYVPGRGA